MQLYVAVDVPAAGRQIKGPVRKMCVCKSVRLSHIFYNVECRLHCLIKK